MEMVGQQQRIYENGKDSIPPLDQSIVYKLQYTTKDLDLVLLLNQNCQIQRGMVHFENAVTPKTYKGIHATHLHFEIR